MELLTPLTRDQTLVRFSAADLQLAGLTEADVRDGSAVFGQPWRSGGNALSPTQGAFILAKPDLSSKLNSGASRCGGGGGCSYGGDAVAVRVAKAGTSATRAVYVVDSIVEPRTAQGDCYYINVGRRPMIYCKSLEAKGWTAHDGMFVKRPDSK
jgi:hypothetical protein